MLAWLLNLDFAAGGAAAPAAVNLPSRTTILIGLTI